MNCMRQLLLLLVSAAALMGADLAGKWDFVWQTEGGERRSTLDFKVTGDAVSVEFPGAKAPIRGTIKGGKLTLAGKLYSQEAGEEGDFQLNGTVTGEQIKGTASWQDHGMTFTAGRTGKP